MTDQQLFDKVAKHLLKQMERSADRNGNCVYHNDHGQMCAVGCLIPNELYDKSFEHSPVAVASGVKSLTPTAKDIEVAERIQKAAGLKKNQLDLAQALQNVHDESWPPDWAAQLKHTAKKFHLEFE